MRKTAAVHQKLEADLARLRLPYIAEHYREALNAFKHGKESALHLLASLMAAEVARRDERAMERRIRAARLPKEKTLAEYDFQFPRRIAKQKILRYFDCDFIQKSANLILIGNQGVGKTHLLTALGYTACRQGICTRFVRTIDLINDLIEAQQNGTLGKALRAYSKPALLLLDELGYLPVDKRGADLMFQVVASRYELGSIVISTNRPFKDWGAIFDVDKTLASAMIDRLMHHGEALVIEGKSYRVKDRNLD
jgi:DNA replication protein DnaC